MDAIEFISGRAAPYRKSNVDTDEIIPARFLYRARKDGFAVTLFHDLRLDEKEAERPEFILNQPAYRDPAVLVAGQNFGCGSSREHAVWALIDSGIRCVIAPSFGDIFWNNSVENGLLAVRLPEDRVAQLQDAIEAAAPCEITVDLPAQKVFGPDGREHGFDFDPAPKRALLAGMSSIDITLSYREQIECFEAGYRATLPWSGV